jgi:hypothetical protein
MSGRIVTRDFPILQAVNHWLVTWEAFVQSEGNACGIYVGKCGSGKSCRLCPIS